MLVAEACLLQAVRDKLITDLELKVEQCEIELDNQVPAITHQDYYAVTAGGIRAGPRHKSSGGVYDVLIAARVTMYRRVAHVAPLRKPRPGSPEGLPPSPGVRSRSLPPLDSSSVPQSGCARIVNWPSIRRMRSPALKW